MRSSPLARIAIAVLALAPLTPAAAQGIALGNDIHLTVSGIISASLFASDARFGTGDGQAANFVGTELADWWHGADVRSTRLTARLTGPRFSGNWRAGATVEGDFGGGYTGTGAFSDEQPTPRLRLAYAEVTNGRTTLRIGQDWSLTTGNIPMSMSHIGYVLGWGSGGFIGWRFPGVFLGHMLTQPSAKTRATLRVAALRNSWSDESTPDQPSAGEAGTPQLEARLDFGGSLEPGTWSVYVAGHWDEKDLNGVRPEDSPEPPENDLTSTAIEAGARIQTGALTVHGNAYSGSAMGHQFAHIVQFGDVDGWGAWGQAGLQLGRRWSAWLFYGVDNPEDDDLPGDGARLQSNLLVPMLRYQVGPYSTGIEWLRSQVDYRSGSGTDERTGTMWLWSVRFDF
jgi:hypothetical protein